MARRKASFYERLSEATLKRWLKGLLLIAITCWVIIASSTSAFIFRMFVILFMVGLAFWINNKFNEVIRILKQNEKSASQTESIELEEQIQVEQELMERELEKTQLLEELLVLADLSDDQRAQYLKQINQKEKEVNRLKDELWRYKDKIQQVVSDGTKLILKSSPNMKGIVERLGPEFVKTSSFTMLNESLFLIKNELSDDLISYMESNGYVDEHFHITRNGYKELRKVAKRLA